MQPLIEPEFAEAPFSPPHSRESEEAVIGSVLINPQIYAMLSDVLKSHDFYIHRLGFIWDAFSRLALRSMDIDILTVGEELDRMGHLDEIGGRAYLTTLLNQCPTTLHAESYAETVKEFSGKRDLLAMANRLATFSSNGKSVKEIVSYNEIELGKIALRSGAKSDAVLNSTDAVMGAMQQTNDAANGKTKAVPTGLIDLDKFFRGGVRSGRLYLIAARPGGGKSALLDTIALNGAKAGYRFGILSTEMSTTERVNRMISQVSGIDSQRIESGQILEDEWPAYYHACELVGDLPIMWDDTETLSLSEIRRKAHVMAEQGIDALIVDCVNLIDAEMPYAKPYERINAVCYGLKAIARSKDFDIPILAAHHISRAGEDGEPTLKDLEQAGEKPADVVMFIYQDATDKAMQNVRKLKIAKHRNGPTGYVDLIWRGNLTRFENATSRKLDVSEERKVYGVSND